MVRAAASCLATAGPVVVNGPVIDCCCRDCAAARPLRMRRNAVQRSFPVVAGAPWLITLSTARLPPQTFTIVISFPFYLWGWIAFARTGRWRWWRDSWPLEKVINAVIVDRNDGCLIIGTYGRVIKSVMSAFRCQPQGHNGPWSDGRLIIACDCNLAINWQLHIQLSITFEMPVLHSLEGAVLLTVQK